MNITEVHRAFGAKRLRRFVALVVLFLLLRAIRLPMAALVALIEAGLSRLDRVATAGVSTPDSSPDENGGAR